MDEKKLFFSFQKRLLWENTLRSFLYGLILGGGGVFLLSLIYHVLLRRCPVPLILGLGGGLFFFGFVFSFSLFFPTKRRTASRMDEMGLEERMGTMLWLRGRDDTIARLQREDALEKARGLDVKKMPWHLSRRLVLGAVICTLLAVLLLLIPYDAFAIGRPDLGKENRLFVERLLEELREKAEEEKLRDEMKEELEEMIRDLEEELKKSQSEIEQAAKLEEAKKKLDEIFKKEVSGDVIGKALQAFEITRPLGFAIEKADEEAVRSALDAAKRLVLAHSDVRLIFSQATLDALLRSGVPMDDPLYMALEKMALFLRDADPEKDTFQSEVTSIFATAEKEILAALAGQASAKAFKESLIQALEEGKKEALGQGEKKTEEETITGLGRGEEEETKTDEAESSPLPTGEEKPGQGAGSGTPGSGPGEGEGVSRPNEMTEAIFDPISGATSYGQVFALYYAEYLKALDRGTLTEDESARLDRYFSSLT